MKKIIIFILIFVNSLLMYSQSTKPKIIWEKYYKPLKLENIWLYFFDRKGDKLYLGYLGRTPENIGKFQSNNGLIITDIEGKVLNHFEILNDITIKIDYVKELKDKLMFIGKYGLVYYPVILKTDYQGNLLSLIIDSSYKNTPYIISKGRFSFPSFKGDSLMLFSKYYDSSEFYYEFYNEDFELLSKIRTDFSGSTISYYNTNHIQFIYKSKDNYIYVTYPGPSDSIYSNNFDYKTLFKLDMNGKLLWQKKLEFGQYKKITPQKFIEDSLHNFIVFGDLVADERDTNFIGYLKNTGEFEWIKLYPSRVSDDYIELFNHKYYVDYGRTYLKELDKFKYWFIILDNKGNPISEYSWSNFGVDNKIVGMTYKDNGHLIMYGHHDFDSLYLAELEIPALSVNENIKTINNIAIYPNPASDKVTINLKGFYGHTELILQNSIGKTLNKINLPNVNKYDLNISNLTPGLYLITIMNDKGYKTFKFIKNY